MDRLVCVDSPEGQVIVQESKISWPCTERVELTPVERMNLHLVRKAVDMLQAWLRHWGNKDGQADSLYGWHLRGETRDRFYFVNPRGMVVSISQKEGNFY